MKIRGQTITTPIARSAVVDDTSISNSPWSSKNTVDRLAPALKESGNIVTFEPVEGYPLEVVTTIEAAADGLPVEGLDLVCCGKNLFDKDGNDFNDGLKEVTCINGSGNEVNSWGYCINLPAGTYTLHAELAEGATAGGYIYGAVNNSDGFVNACHVVSQGKEKTVTVNLAEGEKIYLYNGTTSNASKTNTATLFAKYNIQIEVGSVATNFEPFNIHGFSGFNFGADNDIYSGSYNWATGELIDNNGNVYEESVWEILAEAGVHSLWSVARISAGDRVAGSTTVIGRADPTATIERLTNAILALGGNI